MDLINNDQVGGCNRSRPTVGTDYGVLNVLYPPLVCNPAQIGDHIRKDF